MTDFTVVDGGPDEPEELTRIFAEIAEWLGEESGINLVIDDKAFGRRRNRRGNATTQGRIAYQGPNTEGRGAVLRSDNQPRVGFSGAHSVSPPTESCQRPSAVLCCVRSGIHESCRRLWSPLRGRRGGLLRASTWLDSSRF